jgi:uncharacterized membrane protein/protein-disulfide isomerase
MLELGRRTILTIRVASLIAMAVSAYLLWITFTNGTVAACGDGASHITCDHVLRSTWSRWLGVPVSLFGFAVYLAILLASFWITPTVGERFRNAAQNALVALVTMAAGSALWFLGLQIFVIGKFCLFCMSIHLCGVSIAALLVVVRLRERSKHQVAEQVSFLQRASMGKAAAPSDSMQEFHHQTHRPWLPFAIAAFGLLALVSGQIFLPAETIEVYTAADFDTGTSSTLGGLDSEPAANENSVKTPDAVVPSPTADAPLPAPKADADMGSRDANDEASALATPIEKLTPLPRATKSRRVSLLKGKFSIDVYKHGLLGSPEAEHVIVELVDYTCKDCRKLHQYFKQVREQYSNRLAIVVLPTPLDTSCNPHVQRTHPSHVGACKYAKLALAVWEVDPEAFHEYHDWLMEPQFPPSLQDAERKATEMLDEQLLKVAINGDKVEARLQAHFRLFRRVGRFPAMIVGDEIVIGVPKSAADLSDILEKRLNMAVIEQRNMER